MKFLQKCMNVAMPGKNATKKQKLAKMRREAAHFVDAAFFQHFRI